VHLVGSKCKCKNVIKTEHYTGKCHRPDINDFWASGPGNSTLHHQMKKKKKEYRFSPLKTHFILFTRATETAIIHIFSEVKQIAFHQKD
jgi:hypothetical protein